MIREEMAYKRQIHLNMAEEAHQRIIDIISRLE
jgi:flagellar motor switch protein FliG